MAKGTCSIDGCERPAKRRGWCGSHYARWLNYGNVHTHLRAENGEPLSRFERLTRIETDAHVLWPYGQDGSGYGQLRTPDRPSPWKTHNLALRRRASPPSDDHVACHSPEFSCPRHCMNYRHLYWGTRAQNNADMIISGTSTAGEKSTHSKLTWEEVREIRRLYSMGGRTQRALGDQFGVRDSMINRIVLGRNWRE